MSVHVFNHGLSKAEVGRRDQRNVGETTLSSITGPQ